MSTRNGDELVLAFLDQREERWTYGRVEAEARRGATPDEQLFAVVDLFAAPRLCGSDGVSGLPLHCG